MDPRQPLTNRLFFGSCWRSLVPPEQAAALVCSPLYAPSLSSSRFIWRRRVKEIVRPLDNAVGGWAGAYLAPGLKTPLG